MPHSDFLIDDKGWNALVKKESRLFRRALKKTLLAAKLPVGRYTFSIVLTNDASIKKLNAQYRKKNKATNVLSFPLYDDLADIKKTVRAARPQAAQRALGPINLGDIVIALQTVKAEAKLDGKTFRDHTAHLMVHGLLHLLGFDHMTDREAKKMEKLEIAVLNDVKIADPYR